MLIPARNIPRYLHTLVFPLEVREAKGNRVVVQIDRQQLLHAIEMGTVIAVGTYNRIKYLRMNELDAGVLKKLDRHAKLERKLFRRVPLAEDNHTVERETVAGGTVFRHIPERCNAYFSSARHWDWLGG